MAITNEERNYLKDKLIELLEEYDYKWTDAALEEIIDTWEENKGDLIKAFKTHPNYIEGKFMIAFDTDYDRAIDTNAVRSFSDWLTTEHVLASMLQHRSEEITKRTIQDCCAYLPSSLWYFLKDLDRYASRTISEETADLLNRIIPEAHAHPGQKTTRVINKICKYIGYDKVDGYNREFAKYADALTPLKITRHTILSLHPLDYLTMSFGNSWLSCHTIDKTNKRDMPNGYQGAYSSGTMSYLLDESSFVFYTVESGYNGTDYFTQPKVTRQMFHYGHEKLVQGRLYPANGYGAEDIYKQYRNVVQEIIAQVFNLPNLWTLKRNFNSSEYIYSQGTHYRDYAHFGECTISLLKGSENYERMIVGHTPICVECGCTHCEEDIINCCSRNGSYKCADCGEWLDEDDVRWVDGQPYCYDCADWCECCEEYVRTETHYIENYGSVCENCLDEYFRWCDCCEAYVWHEDTHYIDSEGKYVCDHCYDTYYRSCAECGEVYYKDDMFEHNGNYYCEDCWEAGVIDEAIIEEMENEEEAV